jgi:hypothetical protein
MSTPVILADRFPSSTCDTPTSTSHVIIARAELRDRHRPSAGNYVIVNMRQWRPYGPLVAHARSTAVHHCLPLCYPAASAAVLRWFSHDVSDPSSTRCMPATSASTGAPAEDSVVST